MQGALPQGVSFRRCSAKAQEGFGGSGEKKNPQRRKKPSVSKKKVEKMLRSIESGGSRPVDPKEAAEGRLDYATVKDWGGEERPIELEDLEVKNFTADPTTDPSLPFYNRMTKTLELLQGVGELETEKEKLRPFQEWEFEVDQYGTVVVNLARAHLALEKAIAKVSEANGTSDRILDMDMEVLKYISSERLLDRGLILMDDFENFIMNTGEVANYDVIPERTVYKYEDYLERVTEAGIDTSQKEKQVEALCKLVAHAYILRVMHFTSGTRIAAAAVDKLQLIEKNAAKAYEVYPEGVTDPVVMFVEDLNKIGKLLTEEHKALVFQELPEAFKMTSVFYAPLAREPGKATADV